MKKYSFHLFSILFLSLLSSLSFAVETLRVGMELAYPPFEMSDKNNKPTGISVEIATALAEKLGKKLEIVNMSFDGLIPSLKTKKIDLILSSMTITEERKKTVDFSDGYVKTGLAVLANAKSSLQKAEDLDQKNIKIAVKKGTTGHIWATKNIKNAKVLLFDKESTAILEVTQAKVDAFLYDQMSVYRHWKDNQSSTRALLKPFQQEEWGIALNPGQDNLKKQINDFLQDFRKKGGFDKLADKYFKAEKKAFQDLGVGFIF